MNVQARIGAFCAALTLLGAIGAPVALAADGDGASGAITASITAGSVGSRAVTSVSPIALSSALNASTLTANYAVVVSEAARTGTDPWSVTAVATNLTDGLGNSIPASALSVTSRAVSKVGSGGVESATSGSQSLDVPRTLFRNDGQNTTAVYTGTHTGTGTIVLTPPNGTVAGLYSGTLTVTLVN